MLTKQQYADRCLIVVGCGGEADELLCKRRLSAGGRLAHITCQGENDPRVIVDRQGQIGKSFLWQPPAFEVPVSALGKKFGALKRRRFTKTGPDAVVLRDDQTVTVYDQGGDLRHLRIFNDEGACKVEMSGQVILCPSLRLAQEMDVGVHDECLKAFGTYSFRYLLPSIVIQCALQILRLMTITYLENLATFGAAISNTVIGVLYGAMLQTGTMPVRASLFLPLATAACEVFIIAWMQHSYSWMVWPRRETTDGSDGSDGHNFDGSVVGDHFFLPAATMAMAAHALAESIRMGATFSAAAASGSYAWILSVLLTMMLNITTRLGWTRFVRFGTLKRLGWVQIAVKVSGPSSWHMLHENIKIYGGYGRFAAVLALITSRTVMHRFAVSPAFNASAGYALLAMLAAEVVEDCVVLRELLPTAPIPQEVIWRDEAFDNSTPLQLVAVERRRRSCLGTGTRSVTAPAISASSRVHPVTFDSVSMENPDATISVVSLGPHEERWRSVTSWLGQPRVLKPALPLHGLRELPFHIQLGSVGVMIEVTFGVLFVLLGPGFALGLVEDICTSGSQTVAESLFFLEHPTFLLTADQRAQAKTLRLAMAQNAGCALPWQVGEVGVQQKKFHSCGSIFTAPGQLLDWERAPEQTLAAATDQPSLLFVCNGVTGEKIPLRLVLALRVAGLKVLLEELLAIPQREMKLSYKGKVLDDRRTLLDSGVEARQCIHVSGTGKDSRPFELPIYGFKDAPEPFYVQARACDLVIHVKQEISQITGRPLNSLRLTNGGRTLANECRLCDCGIRDESCVLQIAACNGMNGSAQVATSGPQAPRAQWNSSARKHRCRGSELFLSILQTWPPGSQKRMWSQKARTILQLKEGLEDFCGVSAQQQILMHCGRHLDDHNTLEYYNFEGGECLQLMHAGARVKGGPIASRDREPTCLVLPLPPDRRSRVSRDPVCDPRLSAPQPKAAFESIRLVSQALAAFTLGMDVQKKPECEDWMQVVSQALAAHAKGMPKEGMEEPAAVSGIEPANLSQFDPKPEGKVQG
ncbi:unnamed protein product [Effrenium voratum]|nr:unnamed protein product [Effrenium voratum]